MSEDEKKAVPLEKVARGYHEEKAIYLSRLGARKNWENEIEEQLDGLNDEQKTEVLVAVNTSSLSLADMSGYVGLLRISNVTCQAARHAIAFSLADFDAELKTSIGKQRIFYEEGLKQINQVNSLLQTTLTAVLKRADESVDLIDKRANEAIAKVHEKTDSGAVAREAVEVAQKEATKAIFKEIGGALKGYVKREVEAQIHKRTTFLNAVWFTVVLVGVPASFLMGRLVH